MKTFNTNTANNDEWLTPPYIVEALGSFDLDPCSPINAPWKLAPKVFTKEDDGLTQDWGSSRVWLNPPYGKETFKWLKRLADHGKGIALIFARTETIGFHKEVWDKADSIFFFKGRLRFYKVDGNRGDTANAPSCLISYSPEDTHAIEEALLKENLIQGKLIKIRNDGNCGQ